MDFSLSSFSFCCRVLDELSKIVREKGKEKENSMKFTLRFFMSLLVVVFTRIRHSNFCLMNYWILVLLFYLSLICKGDLSHQSMEFANVYW